MFTTCSDFKDIFENKKNVLKLKTVVDTYLAENNIKDLDFVNEMLYYKKASKYSIENVENIEKIVKLSTCSYLNNRANPTTQRYYIVAKLEIIDNNN